MVTDCIVDWIPMSVHDDNSSTGRSDKYMMIGLNILMKMINIEKDLMIIAIQIVIHLYNHQYRWVNSSLCCILMIIPRRIRR